MEGKNVTSPLRAAGYFAIAAHFWLSCYFDWNYVNVPEEIHPIGFSFGNTKKLKFLTYLNALLQSFFFTVCFINEIIGTTELFPPPKKTSIIRKFKDILLPSLAFPLAMFVGLTFWALYAIDRELVFPRAVDPYFPWWLNHVMHTNVMAFVAIETCTAYRRYPARRAGLAILGCFMLGYLAWVHVIRAYTGRWVYPVLDALDPAGRAAFFAGLFCLAAALYLLGEKLNDAVWARRVPSEKGFAKGKRN